MADTNNLWPGWETVGLIGQGSFGSVYEIQRDFFGEIEKAALKVITIPQKESDVQELYSEGYDKDSITERFHSRMEKIAVEYRLMRKLNGCSNIVNCDESRAIQHDDGIGWDMYIKMELLTPLMKKLPKELPEETAEEIAVHVGKDICNALELCRKHNIIHRDIKPQNIMCSNNGDFKLGDFGVAKTVERTMSGTVAGSYKYMSPEVYHNQPYGIGADIYSLGMVMYWMLNERRQPFLPLPPHKVTTSMDEQALDRRFSGEQLPPPAHGSEVLKAIVLKACAFDPKDRYANAGQMLEALNKLGDPYSETPPAEQPVPVSEEEDEEATVLDTGVKPQDELHRREQERLAKEREEAARKAKAEAERIAREEAERKAKAKAERIAREEAERIAKAEAERAAEVAEYRKAAAERTRELHIQQETEKMSNMGKGAFKVLLGAALVLIALLVINPCLLKGGHEWAPATCTSPQTCTECNRTKGASLGDHVWMDATKTDPATCERCGETTGTCLMPTLIHTNLSWSGEGRPEVGSSFLGVTLSVPEWDDFRNSKITITNAKGAAVSPDAFLMFWTSGKVCVRQTNDLAFGVYHITFACKNGKVTYSVCYGYEGDIYLSSENVGWEDFRLKNWKHDRFLIKSDNKIWTTANASAQYFYENSSQICGIDRDADGNVLPATNGSYIKFVTTQYIYHGEAWIALNTLTYKEWYLASDSAGNVYFTEELTEDCYWKLWQQG